MRPPRRRATTSRPLFANVPRLWGEYVFSGGLKDRVRTRLARSLHGDSSGVRGAAWLWRG
jgi:fructokinase